MVSALLKHSTSLDQPCVSRRLAMHEAINQGPKDLRALLLNLGSTVYPRRVWGHIVRCCCWVQSLWCVGTANHKGGRVPALVDAVWGSRRGQSDCTFLLPEYEEAGMPLTEQGIFLHTELPTTDIPLHWNILSQ